MAPQDYPAPPEPAEEEDDRDIWAEIEETEASLATKIAGVTLGGLAILVVIGLAVGTLGVIFKIATQGQIDPHLSPLNSIFASRAVVAASRITLLFVAAYVIASCIGLMAAGRWLNSFWPLKASDPIPASVQTIDEARESADSVLGEAYETIDSLQAANQALAAEITEMGEAYDEAIDYINRLEAERSGNASDT